LHLGQKNETLAKMGLVTDKAIFPDSDYIEAIPATEMKNAHGVRLPTILKNQGVARVTRYNQTEYFVLSPEMFGSLMKNARTPQSDKLLELKAQYRATIERMRTPKNKKAFAALSKASAEDLGAAVKLSASD
jgi:hypothetical protein